MTPYDRLMAEAIPTGTFGHAPPPTNPHTRPWTALEQAEHRRILDEALDGWHQDRDERPQLHLVSDTATETAA